MKLRWLLYGLGGLAAAVCLILSAVFVFLQTGSGKTLLSTQLSRVLSSPPHQQVLLEELDGFLPFEIRLKRATMSDAQGKWLLVEDLALQWSPAALLLGNVRVSELSASRVEIVRSPEGPPEEKPREEPFAPKLPSELPSVMVEKIAVSQLVLGEALLGQAAVFSIDGAISPGDSHKGLSATLRIDRTDPGPPTSLGATADIDTRESRLGLQFSLDEEPDGWIAAVAGLKDAGRLHAGLEGIGPLEAWKGKLRLEAGKYAVAHGDVELELTERTVLALQGELQAAPEFLPPEWSLLVGPRTSFALSLRSVPGTSLAVDRAWIAAAGFTAEGHGEYMSESQAIQGSLNLDMAALSVLEPFAKKSLDGRLAFEAKIGGTAGAPQADLSLLLEQCTLQDVSVGRLQTEVKLTGKEIQDGMASVFRVSGIGSAHEIRGLSEKGLPHDAAGWSLEADIPREGDVILDRLEVKSQGGVLEAKGRFNPETLAGSIQSQLQIGDLKDLEVITGPGYSGHATVRIELDSDEGLKNAATRLDGEISGLKGLPPQISPLLGSKVTLKSRLDLKDKEQLDLSSFKLDGEGFSLEAGGRMNLGEQTLQGDLTLTLPDLRVLSEAAGKPITGRANVKGQARGALNALDVLVVLEGAPVVVDGQTFDKVDSQFKGSSIPGAPKGDFSIHIHQGRDKLTLLTNFAQDGPTLHLKDFQLQGPGTAVEGDVALHFAKPLAEGRMDGKFTDLAALGRFLGTQLKGTADFKARMKETRGRQDLSLQLGGKGIGGAFGDVRTITLKADLENVLEAPRGQADLSLKDFTKPGFMLKELALTSRGDGKSLAFETTARGEARHPFSVDARGAVSRADGEDRLTFGVLRGKYGQYPFELKAPLNLSRRHEAIMLGSLDFQFGKARLDAQGTLDQNRVDLRASLDGLPLTMLAAVGLPEFSGDARATLEVKGNLNRPEADLTLQLDGLRSTNPDFQNVPPALVTAGATIQRDELKGQLQVERLFQKPARAELALPVRFSLAPFVFEASSESPFRGHLEAQADLHALMGFFPQEDHKARGTLNTNLDVAGSMKAPQVTGEVSITDGHYENWANGTVLDQLTLRMTASGSRLEIQELQATDGQRGNIRGEGWVDLDIAAGIPFDVAVNMTNARLVRRDNFTGTVAGSLNLSGTTTRRIVLDGDLVFGPAEIDIGRRTAPAVARLDVIEIREGDLKEEQSEPRERTPPVEIDLEVKIHMPNRVFVRGSGLESEWQGNLKVQGTADAPAPLGNLETVRGHFDFLDKRFQIVKGVIQFNGMYPPSPIVDITAEAKGKDMVGRIMISGFASSPKIELESDPPLPRDEILARLLFGRNLSQITPVQGIKLAQAVRSLSSGNGEPGILDRTRRLLGMDQFELREGLGESSPAAIGIGKYLSEDIYVDVQKDISGQAGRATVEVEITPNIAVQGQAGSDASTGMGVTWKYDY